MDRLIRKREETLSQEIEAEQEIMKTDRRTSESKLHKKLQHRVGKAIHEFGLIDRGDRVLLALSGGKDSLSLLDLLGERMARSGGYFTVEALHVRMRNVAYESDTSWLAERAGQWNIPLHVVETGFEPDRNPKRSACFLCAWHRRKVLFNEAQRLGCAKVALGHHQDDILRTALMNLTYNGSFSTMPVRLKMRKFPVTLIRPLALIAESDLKLRAQLLNYPSQIKVCPYDHHSCRTSVLSLTRELELLNPDYRHSLWHALQKANLLISEDGDGRTLQ